MKELILQALRESIKEYPELKQYLQGDAEWMADVFNAKFNPPPDNKIRLRDEKELADILEDYFIKQNKRIITELRKEFVTKGIFDSSFWNRELNNLWQALSKKVSDILVHGVETVISILPEDLRNRISINLLQTDVIRYALNYREEWINTINQNTMTNIWKQVEIWRTTGQPIDQLIEKLQRMGFPEMRAKRIAVTETTRLNSIAHQLSYEQSGVTHFRYMTYGDNNVCELCVPHHGHEYPISQLSSMIPQHPNCRCWDEPVFEGMPTQADYGDL